MMPVANHPVVAMVRIGLRHGGGQGDHESQGRDYSFHKGFLQAQPLPGREAWRLAGVTPRRAGSCRADPSYFCAAEDWGLLLCGGAGVLNRIGTLIRALLIGSPSRNMGFMSQFGAIDSAAAPKPDPSGSSLAVQPVR